jgi:hypothetical protein
MCSALFFFSTQWAATFQTNQKAWDLKNVKEASKSLRAVSFGCGGFELLLGGGGAGLFCDRDSVGVFFIGESLPWFGVVLFFW